MEFNKLYHEDCFELAFCDCGRRVWDESGLCLDCLSKAEDQAEWLAESQNEEEYYKKKYKGGA
jgi:hypothetical protein